MASVARGPLGRDMTNETLKSDHDARPFWVTPDLRIFLEAFSPIYEQARDFLIAICEPVSRPQHIHEYKLSQPALFAAASMGLSAELILEALNKLSKTSVPPSVAKFVRSCTSGYGKAKLVLHRSRYFVESRHPAVLRLLATHPGIRAARINLPTEAEKQERLAAPRPPGMTPADVAFGFSLARGRAEAGASLGLSGIVGDGAAGAAAGAGASRGRGPIVTSGGGIVSTIPNGEVDSVADSSDDEEAEAALRELEAAEREEEAASAAVSAPPLPTDEQLKEQELMKLVADVEARYQAGAGQAGPGAGGSAAAAAAAASQDHTPGAAKPEPPQQQPQVAMLAVQPGALAAAQGAQAAAKLELEGPLLEVASPASTPATAAASAATGGKAPAGGRPQVSNVNVYAKPRPRGRGTRRRPASDAGAVKLVLKVGGGAVEGRVVEAGEASPISDGEPDAAAVDDEDDDDFVPAAAGAGAGGEAADEDEEEEEDLAMAGGAEAKAAAAKEVRELSGDYVPVDEDDDDDDDDFEALGDEEEEEEEEEYLDDLEDELLRARRRRSQTTRSGRTSRVRGSKAAASKRGGNKAPTSAGQKRGRGSKTKGGKASQAAAAAAAAAVAPDGVDPTIWDKLQHDALHSQPLAGSQTLSFEIDHGSIDTVRRLCEAEFRPPYPLMQEYDFREDRFGVPDLELQLQDPTALRPYQEKSLAKMFGNGRARSGLIVLPCGAGKTFVGIAAACTIAKSTIVLCPNQNSVEQWHKQFFDFGKVEHPERILKFTSSNKTPLPPPNQACVILCTYSMMAKLAHLKGGGNLAPATREILRQIAAREWGLMVLDEVHTAVANTFQEALTLKCHCRLGLTATLVREDGRVEELSYRIGPKLYEANWMDLTVQGYLSNVQICEVWCPMTPEFYAKYLECPEDRRRMAIAAMNPTKIWAMDYLLRVHQDRPGDKIIVFSESVWVLEELAKRYQQPVITGKTPHKERRQIISAFRSTGSELRILFLSKVGDMALDIPNANVIIQLSSHYGARMQEAQRLGRILRKGSGRQGVSKFNAFFYTLISTDTREVYFSNKRRRYLCDQGYAYKVIPAWPHLRPTREQLERESKYMSKREEQEVVLARVMASDLERIEAAEDAAAEQEGESMARGAVGRGGRVAKGRAKVRRMRGSASALSGGQGLSYAEYDARY